MSRRRSTGVRAEIRRQKRCDHPARRNSSSRGTSSLHFFWRDQQKTDSEIGILVRGGARAMVWRGLELFADLNGSNIALVENDLFFEVGGRHHFLHDAFDLGSSGRFGTNDLQALNVSARVYYAELWRWARGK